MNDEELDIFWRLKRLEEKKNQIKEKFSDTTGSLKRSESVKPSPNTDNQQSYSIPEIKTNTFYQSYKEKQDRVLRRRLRPRPVDEGTNDNPLIEKHDTITGAPGKRRRSNYRPTGTNWFKVSIVLSLLLCAAVITSFSLSMANRQPNVNILDDKNDLITELEAQIQTLIKENESIKEQNESLVIRNERLRDQLIDTRNTLFKLQNTYQNQMINEDYAMFLALDFVHNEASKNLPVHCGTENPEIVRVYYERATIEKQNRTFEINMPVDIRYQSNVRYICYIEMDESGSITHWYWQGSN